MTIAGPKTILAAYALFPEKYSFRVGTFIARAPDRERNVT
jgi:hypothetical protein